MFLWEAKGLFERIQVKKLFKIVRIFISANLVLQIGWVPTFFL
jgi:hypothetical protein